MQYKKYSTGGNKSQEHSKGENRERQTMFPRKRGNKGRAVRNTVKGRCWTMLSPAIFLILNGLFFTLHLSGGSGSFPQPLKPKEEREYLERWAQGDMEARNVLIERNLRLVAHIAKKMCSKMQISPVKK